MPSPFFKDDKSGKPEKPEKQVKPEKADKPFSIPSVPLEFMPPAANHPNRLVSVTGTDGTVLCLSFSDGIEWRTLKFDTTVPLPAPVEPEVPETPAVPAV
jgi:hypothetical protein